MSNAHHIKTSIVATLILGIALIVEGTLTHVRLAAELTGHGSMIGSPATEQSLDIVQSPLHEAAPTSPSQGTAKATLLIGMLMILAGFGLSLLLIRSERVVHITVKPSMKRDRSALRLSQEHWFWVQLDL